MKRLIALLALTATSLFAAGPLTNAVKWVLVWDNHPGDVTNFVFRLYTSSTPGNFVFAQVVTNPAPINNGAQLAFTNSYPPGNWFFTMTTSNAWGESPFSNVAGTPPVPPTLLNLGLLLGQ